MIIDDKVLKSSLDHYETPRYIVDNIFNLLSRSGLSSCSYWFPFDTDTSEFVCAAKSLGINFTRSHILENGDFFNTSFSCDYVLSNPPFSILYDILRRLFYLYKNGTIKGFILLVPLATLETPKRAELLSPFLDLISLGVFKYRIIFKGHWNSFNRPLCLLCFNVSNLPKFFYL